MPPAHENASGPSAELLFGVAGWSYSDWEGIVYPAGASGEAKLITVASACDLLEVNTTFYATPNPAMTAAWVRRLSRAGLPTRLVVKINQAFTHKEDYSPADLAEFRHALAPLDDDGVIDRNGVEHPRLLGLLMQFPFSFRLTPENTQRIERLAEDLADWTKIIELRHPSWARASAFDWLRKHGLSLANIDLPGARPEGARGRGGERAKTTDAETGDAAASGLPFRGTGGPFPRDVVATGPVGYLRLHGRNSAAWFDRKAPMHEKYNYLYSPAEVKGLAERVRELAGRTQTVAVVGNNHYRGKALATVLNIAHLLDGRRVELPATMLQEYPELRAFAEPVAAPSVPSKSSKPPRKKRPDSDGGQMKLFE